MRSLWSKTWPFGPLDLTANLPCVEIERAIAHGLPLPQMPTAIPGVTRLKRLRSKSRFRARRSDDGVFRDGERGRVKQWRVANPDKARAHKQNERLANYTRRFVAIDAEGQNYSSADILYDGVRYAQHGTYLWGAAADDGQPPHWLLSPETRGIDKKPLGAIEILDWLLDLPRKFGRAVWAMFSFGYDVAQILRHLPFRTAWEIEKRETYPDANGNTRPIGHAPVFWKGYAISYAKGKSIDIWRLADPDKPWLPPARAGGKKRLNKSAHSRIFDVFAFFQSSFSAVTDSMAESGRATKDEADYMRVMKGLRDQFATVPIEEIKTYTTLELRLLARMMADLRNGFDETGLHLRGWHGAGAAASALIESQKLKVHYGEDIAASDISPQQDAAHHAYFGGRIELLKQGYMEGASLHVYDIASAYPAAMVEFPSLASGEWANKQGNEFASGTLSELRAVVEAASCVSMFKIRYQFPVYEKYDPDARKAVFVPFYGVRHG